MGAVFWYIQLHIKKQLWIPEHGIAVLVWPQNLGTLNVCVCMCRYDDSMLVHVLNDLFYIRFLVLLHGPQE